MTLLRFKYRAMLGDTFIDVDADTEEEAKKFARCQLIQALRDEDFIVWQTGDNERGGGCAMTRITHTDGKWWVPEADFDALAARLAAVRQIIDEWSRDEWSHLSAVRRIAAAVRAADSADKCVSAGCSAPAKTGGFLCAAHEFNGPKDSAEAEPFRELNEDGSFK